MHQFYLGPPKQSFWIRHCLYLLLLWPEIILGFFPADIMSEGMVICYEETTLAMADSEHGDAEYEHGSFEHNKRDEPRKNEGINS